MDLRAKRSRVGVVVLLCCLALLGACERCASGPPNVLLVVLDTERADAVHGYGAPESQTPTIAALASEGTLFEQARTTTAWTVPAHASMFTGRYPSGHGVHNEGGGLALEAVTLAELLSATHATAGVAENPHIKKGKNFDQGFSYFANTWKMPRDPKTKALQTNRLVLDWLAKHAGERPFMMFINYMTPHLPYRPPLEYQAQHIPADADPARIEWLRELGDKHARYYIAKRLTLDELDLTWLRQLYAAEATYVDAQLREVIEALRARRWLDNTLVVIVGDHGENIGDHGLMEHQFCLYESLLRVPMIMRLPRVIPAGLRRDDPVQLVDLLPTILSITGVPSERWPRHRGLDLLAGPVAPERPVVAEYMLPRGQQRIFAKQVPGFDFTPLLRRLKSIQIGSDKLIVSDRDEVELYDLASDPDEQRDLASAQPERAAALSAQLQAWLDRSPRPFGPTPAHHSTGTLESLRQLGYVE